MQVLQRQRERRPLTNPRPLVWLVNEPAAGWLWLVVRLYVGWQWLSSGRDKLMGASSVGWVHGGVSNGKPLHEGDRLLAFWQHAIGSAQGQRPQVAFGWYRDFLSTLVAHHTQGWFAHLIAYGELLAGVGLLLGAFTGVAALSGALLSFNYMLAGSAGLNPVLFLGAALLVLAWRVSGHVGLDRWLLPLFGAPWQPGRALHHEQVARPAPVPRPRRVPRRQRWKEAGAGLVRRRRPV